MKLSNIIEILENLKQQHGDLNINITQAMYNSFKPSKSNTRTNLRGMSVRMSESISESRTVSMTGSMTGTGTVSPCMTWGTRVGTSTNNEGKN